MTSKEKRDLRKLAKTCINGTIPVKHGRRCERCKLTHKYGYRIAYMLPEYINAPECNPDKYKRIMKKLLARANVDGVLF